MRKKASPAAFPLWYEEAMLAVKVKEIIAKVQERTEVTKAQVQVTASQNKHISNLKCKRNFKSFIKVKKFIK